MCQDDAIVTFDHLLVHTNMLQHLFQTIPYCVLRRSCIDQCRFKLSRVTTQVLYKDKNAAEVSIRPIHFVEEKTDAL